MNAFKKVGWDKFRIISQKIPKKMTLQAFFDAETENISQKSGCRSLKSNKLFQPKSEFHLFFVPLNYQYNFFPFFFSENLIDSFQA